MHGKENRLNLSTTGLPARAFSDVGPTSPLRCSLDSAVLSQGTVGNKRQQMLRYSASRRLSLKPPTGKTGKKSKVGTEKGEGVRYGLCVY